MKMWWWKKLSAILMRQRITTTWILHIRDGVQFSNGNQLTPGVVKESLERVYQAEADGTGNSTPSQYVTFFQYRS